HVRKSTLARAPCARGMAIWFRRSRRGRRFGWWPFSAGARLDRSAEDPVDELGGSFATEQLGQFYGLVNCRSERHCSIAVQGFIEADAQDVAVNRRHLCQWPQRRAQLNQPVNGRAIGEHA